MATIGQIASGSAPSVPGLRRDAIGLREVLFQSITDMAPGAAIAASIPAGALYAGGALPLSVLIALVACLLTASCIGLLARELPSAGSLATYVARGLHPAVGFLTAWGYVLVYVLVAPLVLLQLGFTTASTINSDFHGYPANLWWPWSLAGAVIILAAGFYGIRTSARLGTILGTTEIAVFLVLAVLFVVHAGHANTASVFTTKYTPKGFHGISGVIAGSVYSILAFGGFEGAAPLAEEARNPRRTIPRPALRVHHLRGGRGLRPGSVRRIRQLGVSVLGGDGPLAVRPVLVLRVPRHRQLHDRERQRRGQRGQQDRLRDGKDPGLPRTSWLRCTPGTARRWWPSSPLSA